MSSKKLFTSLCSVRWPRFSWLWVGYSTSKMHAGFHCLVIPICPKDFPSSDAFLFLPFNSCFLQPSWICLLSTRWKGNGWAPPLYHVHMCPQKVSHSKYSPGAWSETTAPPPSFGGMNLVTTSCWLGSETGSASQSAAQGMPHSVSRTLKFPTVDTTPVKSSGGLKITA